MEADDALTIDATSIRDASVEIVDSELEIDVDALSGAVGEEREAKAVEACFRRYGYSHRGWGGGYGNGCYDHCHSYCRPLYSYRTINYCPPVYRCIATPVYHYYWGCQ